MKKRLEYIKHYMRPYWIQFIIVLLIVLVTTSIVAVYPYLFGKLVDALLYNKNVSKFYKIGLFYFVIFLINQALHYCLNMMVAKLYVKFSYAIKKGIFKKVLSYKSQKLSDINSGDVIYRINTDAEEVLNFIYSDLIYGLSAILDFSLCFAITSYISLPLGGICLLLSIITIIITNKFKDKLKPCYNKVAKMTALNQSWLFEFLNGMRDIRLLNAAKFSMDKYINFEKQIIDENKHIMTSEIYAQQTNLALQIISTILIFSVAAFCIAFNILTLGGLISIVDYFNRMIVTLNRVYTRIFTISKRLISINRLIEIEDIESEFCNDCNSLHKISLGDIKFQNVQFSYIKNQKILNGLDLHIEPGKKIALVGRSGEGKSTIAELLCGLLKCDIGKILIDDNDINNYNLHNLRSQIGLVHQNIMIFHNTIRYNLIFSNDKNKDKEIWDILKCVELDNLIQTMPDGLDTILDQANTLLSGGENQRLSIARVYLKNPKILIFDESSSHLDGKTEEILIRARDQLFPNHTMIIVAHKLSTVLNSDLVAFLENGKIIKYDKHMKLMESCQQYKKLFYDQYYSHLREEM